MNIINKKRQQLLIQKSFQMRSIAIVVAIIITTGILSGLLLYFILSSELSTELQVSHRQIQDIWDRLGLAIFFGNIITVIITGCVAAYAVLLQSHKIAGPMYRLETICNEVTQGNFQPFTSLRKADQLTPLAKSFETMIITLKAKEDKRNEITIEVLAIIDNLMGTNSHNDSLESLNTLRNKLTQLKI